MAGEELFANLPEHTKLPPAAALDPAAAACEGAPQQAPRLREPRRDQIELRAIDIESLIGEDHPARLIWAYVAGLDLSDVENRIKARGETPGRAMTSPRLLVALWLFATSQGVGSARALERLCTSHDAYRWLCGSVSVNYHTLADFRVDDADFIDRLMSEHLASLAAAGLVDLDTLAQDGVRIRANAGAASFRREATLEGKLARAQAVVEELKREVEANPHASNRRVAAAKERAARERSERVQAALGELTKIKERRSQLEERGGNGKPVKEARASTTDPQARVMKMADGGFRPAYNVQVASAAGAQIIVAVAVENNGSDRALMRPMLERLRAAGRWPKQHLVDGGFGNAEDIEWAHREGVEVFCPPAQAKSGADPYVPRRREGVGVAAWRARMASEAGKAQYKKRSICECIHARWRNWDLYQLTVRGVDKVRAVVLWYALTNNILQGHRLARTAALAPT